MKLNRRQLRRLIESAINEEEGAVKSAKKGAVFGGLTLSAMTLADLAYKASRGISVNPAQIVAATEGGLAGVAGIMSAVGLSAAAGYAIGDYLNDYMSGKTGSDDEKFINSFKRHAKDMIGELGVKVFGFEISNTWDTLSDEDYFEKAFEKDFKGLKPNEIDKQRLGQLLGMIIVYNNFSEDKKLPKNIDQLFAYRYLDADAFKPVIEEKQKAFISSIKSKIDKNKLAKSAKSDSDSTDLNESLSRGSLYRRRYRRY